VTVWLTHAIVPEMAEPADNPAMVAIVLRQLRGLTPRDAVDCYTFAARCQIRNTPMPGDF